MKRLKQVSLISLAVLGIFLAGGALGLPWADPLFRWIDSENRYMNIDEFIVSQNQKNQKGIKTSSRVLTMPAIAYQAKMTPVLHLPQAEPGSEPIAIPIENIKKNAEALSKGNGTVATVQEKGATDKNPATSSKESEKNSKPVDKDSEVPPLLLTNDPTSGSTSKLNGNRSAKSEERGAGLRRPTGSLPIPAENQPLGSAINSPEPLPEGFEEVRQIHIRPVFETSEKTNPDGTKAPVVTLRWINEEQVIRVPKGERQSDPFAIDVSNAELKAFGLPGTVYPSDATSIVQAAVKLYKDAEEQKTKDALQNYIEKITTLQFESYQKTREKELKPLEEKVTKLRELHNRREKEKKEIIEDRVRSLLRNADGLGWGDSTTAAMPVNSGTQPVMNTYDGKTVSTGRNSFASQMPPTTISPTKQYATCHIVIDGGDEGSTTYFFPLKGKERVLDVIATLDGITKNADLQVELYRVVPDPTTTPMLTINWQDIISHKSNDTNYELRSGDRLVFSLKKARATTKSASPWMMNQIITGNPILAQPQVASPQAEGPTAQQMLQQLRGGRGGLGGRGMPNQNQVTAPATDSKLKKDEDIKIFSLKNALAKDLGRVLSDIYSGKLSDRALTITSDQRTNSIVVVGKKDDLAVIEALIQKLDKESPAQPFGKSETDKPEKEESGSNATLKLSTGSTSDGTGSAIKDKDILKKLPHELNEMAWKLLTDKDTTKRDVDQAFKLARTAYDATYGEDANIIDTLALAYFEKGNLEAAIAFQTQAVQRAAPTYSHKLKEFEAALEKYKKAPRTAPKQENKDEKKRDAEPPKKEGFVPLAEEAVVVQEVSLQYAPVKDVASKLSEIYADPIAKKELKIVSDERTNKMIVVGKRKELRGVFQLVEGLDVDVPAKKTDPREKLETMIPELIRSVEQNNIREIMEKHLDPEQLAARIATNKTTLDEMVKRGTEIAERNSGERETMVKMLQYIKTARPQMSEDGTLAKYEIPKELQLRDKKEVTFKKIKNLWYLRE